MATIIQIKRSANISAPSTVDLVAGELAYSYDKANDGAGAKLYVEVLDSGDTEVIHAIGGKYYTDKVDGATSAATASKLVQRDAFGSLAANNISLTGNVTVNGTKISGGSGLFVDPIAAGTSGNVVYFNPVTKELTYGTAGAAATADRLTTARDIGLAGALSGNVSFDGSQNVTLTATLATSGVAASTYGGATNIPVLVVDTYGRITSASNVAISTDLQVAGDTTSDTVSLASETLAILGGTGISTSVSGNAFTITNSGVTSATSGGYGLTVSSSTGGITITNSGVTRAIAGSGIGVDAENGNVTITNLGVTGITGTSNEIEVSAANASVQIGLPNDVTIGNNLTVTGNLYVTGTAVTMDTATVTVEDPLVRFGNANPADSLDIGFFGQYTSSGAKFAGLFRDASDSGKFKLFTGLEGDPDTSPDVVDTGGTGYTVATLVANITGGTISGLSSNIAVTDGGTGRGTITTNAVIYGQGSSAVGMATGTAYQVLQLDASGVPVFAGLDGGTY